MSNRGKQQQTVVLSVTVGSPAFMAGLHQGDAIMEVNGEDVRTASPDAIVDKIMNTTEPRVYLVVEFVDGVRRNTLRRERSQLKRLLLQKQETLKEILASGKCPTSYTGIKESHTEANQSRSSKCINNLDEQLYTALPTPKDSNGYQLNVYTGRIASLSSELLVVPLGNPVDTRSRNQKANDEVILTTLLQAGGDKLVNELSLQPHVPLGDILVTSGGKLPGIKSICHCVFGGYDDNLVKCLEASIGKAVEKRSTGVAVWIDGFLSVSVPPSLVLELLYGVMKKSNYNGTVIIASSALLEIQQLVKDVFHLEIVS